MNVNEALRGLAQELLKSGKVSLVIGYREGWDPSTAAPFFVREPSEAARLMFDERCMNSLVKYLVDTPAAGAGAAAEGAGRAAVVLKGCDALGLQRLVADHRVDRQAVYAIGVRCRGPVEGAPAKCRGCGNAEPAGVDVVLGEPYTGQVGPRDMSIVEKLESAEADDRFEYWRRQLERCIRCYACRNVCPACHCRECSLEAGGDWLTAERTLTEQAMYHFARAYHVAGRCTGCGECERVCPVGIPLMAINRKIVRDVRDLFKVEKPEIPADGEPLGRYSADDPEEFM